MLDHVFVSVSDLDRSIEFYERALAPLGIRHAVDYDGANGPEGHPDLKGFGRDGRVFFWLRHGSADARAVHVGFVAKSEAEVDAYYAAAISAGATDTAYTNAVQTNVLVPLLTLSKQLVGPGQALVGQQVHYTLRYGAAVGGAAVANAVLTDTLLFHNSITFFKPIAVLPAAMDVALTGFELLVAVLQAFIFTILTAVYLGGAMHPEH